MFKKLLLIFTISWVALVATDIQFEIQTPKANFLRLIAFEKTTKVFDQEINLTNFTGTKESHGSLKATDDGLLFKYKGTQGLKLAFTVNQNGDIKTVDGLHETAFKDKKSWGFKTPGNFVNAVPSLFYRLNINAKETHNHSIIKAYTGNFSQNYIFNQGIIHFGNSDDCLSTTPYLAYFTIIDSEATPSFKHGIIDDHGVIIAENGLGISNLTHKVHGIAEITGQLKLDNASIENYRSYRVDGPLKGNCDSFTNHNEFFLNSFDSKVNNLVNHGLLDIANTSTLLVDGIFDNGRVESQSPCGVIRCGGSLNMQLAKAPKGLGLVTALDLKTIINEFLDEEALKNVFKNAALLPKNRKFVRKVTTHVDHYLNTITQHSERDQYGFTRDTHKTETGYKFQKRDTSVHEQTIETPEWPQGIKDGYSEAASKRELFKALKEHLKKALQKLAKGQVLKGALAAALQEALGEAGFDDSDIEDFFDDISDLLQGLSEYDENTLNSLSKKLDEQSELSRGKLVESLLNPTQVMGQPLNHSLKITIPVQTIQQPEEVLTPRRIAAKLGYAKAIKYFNGFNQMTRDESLKNGYGPENMAVDYYNQAQREIVQAALWKGLTGKPINAYEEGVVADFSLDLAMNMVDLGIDIAMNLAEGASINLAGKGISFCLKKAFGKFITTAAKGIAGKGYVFVHELQKKSCSILKIKNPVWNESPVIRGEIIEKNWGQNLPQNFPVIDKFVPKTGKVTSIKSLDLNAKTYQDPKKLKSVLERYVDKLEAFKGHGLGEHLVKSSAIKQRALDLAIPHSGNSAQKKVLQEMLTYAKNKGIEFNAIIY